MKWRYIGWSTILAQNYWLKTPRKTCRPFISSGWNGGQQEDSHRPRYAWRMTYIHGRNRQKINIYIISIESYRRNNEQKSLFSWEVNCMLMGCALVYLIESKNRSKKLEVSFIWLWKMFRVSCLVGCSDKSSWVSVPPSSCFSMFGADLGKSVKHGRWWRPVATMMLPKIVSKLGGIGVCCICCVRKLVRLFLIMARKNLHGFFVEAL